MDIINLRTAVLNWLRNLDLISTTERGVSTTTETHSEQEFNLNNSGVKNIRRITNLQTGEDLVLFKDYDWYPEDYGQTYDIEVNESSTDGFEVEYDYGTGDKIYADYPRPDLSLSSYPRIAFDFYGVSSETTGRQGFYTWLKYGGRIEFAFFALSRKEAERLAMILKVYLNFELTGTAENPFWFLKDKGAYIYASAYYAPMPIETKANKKIYKSIVEAQIKNYFSIY